MESDQVDQARSDWHFKDKFPTALGKERRFKSALDLPMA